MLNLAKHTAKAPFRSYKTALNPSKQLQVGDLIGRFKVEQLCEVPEFDLRALKLGHPSGAQMLHLNSSDTNNTFCAGFRTIPLQSTGLPHILEHTVLCGSKRYPCRDPFFNMLNRSLASYMNASTAPDYTIYPFSSKVPADITNLRSVYLDAVFKPNLTFEDFQQEGWRLEHENPHDPSTPIKIKGVVFNEMKGVFSDNQTLFFENLLNSILPSHTYGICSGGDPMEIPKLQHSDLVKFHKDYYTPWNSKFFSYGNLLVEDHIRELENYLDHTEKKDPSLTAIPSEKRWKKPKVKHITCRNDPLAADPNKQSAIALTYLCCDATDLEETLILQLLAELLIKGPNAPFYRTLVEPNIGAGLSPVCGYEPSTKDTFLSIGLQGVSHHDFDMIENIIENTLKEVSETGFRDEHIAGVLHSIELGLKHRGSNFGLSLLFGLTPIWNHDGDVIKALQVEKRLTRIRKKLADEPKLLQNKIKQYLITNPHRLRLTMSPDDKFEEQLKEKENLILTEKLKNLNQEEKQTIYQNGLKLLKLKEINNKSVLPTLKTNDIPKDVEKISREFLKIDNKIPLTVINQPTNGVAYFRAILPLKNITNELLPFVPILADVWSDMGTKQLGFRELDQKVTLHTGGLEVSPHVLDDISRVGVCEESFAIGSYCLERNVPIMIDLWKEVLHEVDLLNNTRFETLIRGYAADAVNSIAYSGHRIASLASASLVNSSAAVRERHSGLSHVMQLQKIASSEDAMRAALEAVSTIRGTTMHTGARCCFTSRGRTEASEQITGLLSAKLGIEGAPPQFVEYLSKERTNFGLYHLLPYDVSFTGQTIETVPYQHEDFAPLRILARYISTKYLHTEIREKGGAYGSGMSLSSNGLLSCYSYRDPKPSRTFEIYSEALPWLLSKKLTLEDLEEAKLGVFQAVDAPVAAGEKGCLEFLHGVSDDALFQHRQNLLLVTIEDLYRVAEKYLTNKPTGRCILGPSDSTLLNDTRYNFKLVE